MLYITYGDHPRTRGEKNPILSWYICCQGSPPHTRGKVPTTLSFSFTERITPAHAGKRFQKVDGLKPSADHPRTRGEKKNIKNSPYPLKGSPPHTRGKACDFPFSFISIRITPAHAGKSYIYCILTDFIQDHPRTRGEKALPLYVLTVACGITPAHAGKRIFLYLSCSSFKDHPRTRGEKIDKMIKICL